MSWRNNWLIIVVTIGWLSCGIAVVVYLGYGAIQIFREHRRLESCRPVLLYQTDHRALLEACKELSKQVTTGELKSGQYNCYSLIGDPDPETKLFPQPILDLKPFQVVVEKSGRIDLIMSPIVMYGACAHPDGSKYGDIELVPGLWYFDEDFRAHPEHKKEVEELLKKRKMRGLTSMP